jgi:hypothetical protein
VGQVALVVVGAALAEAVLELVVLAHLDKVPLVVMELVNPQVVVVVKMPLVALRHQQAKVVTVDKVHRVFLLGVL